MADLRPSSVAGAARRLLLLVGVGGLAGVLVAGIALPVAGALGLSARGSAQAFEKLPDDLVTKPLSVNTKVYGSDGSLLATFFRVNREYVPLAGIAPVMKQALLAVEDDRFYSHGPIDVQGTSRSALKWAASGQPEGGGSTLTQQYVKNVLFEQAQVAYEDASSELKSADEAKAAAAGRKPPDAAAVAKADTAIKAAQKKLDAAATERNASKEQTLSRKLRELRLSIAAEKQFSKDEILERYLNIAYFGGQAYGIQAAAQHYFSTTADKLTLAQASMLAGLVQAPSSYDPERNPERALGRRNTVINRMGDLTWISQADAARARLEPLNLAITKTANGCITSYAPFFCQYVERELSLFPGLGKTQQEREDAILQDGLTIKTTIDPRIQKDADDVMHASIAPTDRAVGAFSVVEPGTGKVRALSQSRPMGTNLAAGETFIDYNANVDHGGGQGVQPGSTMKAFVLAAAIKQGIPLNTQINSPVNISLPQNNFTTCSGKYPVKAPWDLKSSTGSGVLNVLQGTAFSNNTFYAQLEQRTGLCEPWTIATQAGLTYTNAKPLSEVPSFVLGVNEIAPLQLTAAYAMFPAHGVYCKPIVIDSITDASGKPLPVPSADCKQILDKNTADTTTQVLQGVVQGPEPGRTGKAMDLGRPTAGKTGTNDAARAVSFVGFIPQLTAYMNVADVDLPLDGLDGVVLNGVRYPTACGSCIPGKFWKVAMDRIVAPIPPANFDAPTQDPNNPVPAGSVGTPDVRGQDQAGATAALQGAGLNPVVGGQVNSNLRKGLVVYTSPRAGKPVGPGGSVRMYISNGVKPAPSPPAAQPPGQPAQPPVPPAVAPAPPA